MTQPERNPRLRGGFKSEKKPRPGRGFQYKVFDCFLSRRCGVPRRP
jgi:hypothetical protein